jgi:hypothetical protein
MRVRGTKIKQKKVELFDDLLGSTFDRAESFGLTFPQEWLSRSHVLATKSSSVDSDVDKGDCASEWILKFIF